MQLLIMCLLVMLALTAPAVTGDARFDSNGVSIRYIDQGNGDPVVLLHGFSRNVEMNWIQPGIVDALARDFRVIAIDCRGHGQSDKPDAIDAYGIEMVNDVMRLLDHLEIESAHLVGYSMGGRIALKTATMDPQRVCGLTLIAAGRSRAHDHDPQESAQEHEQETENLWDRVADALEEGQGIAPLVRLLFDGSAATLSDEQIAEINAQSMIDNDAAALAHIARRYREFATSSKVLRELPMPVTAIIGSSDPFLPDVNVLQDHIDSMRLVILDGADHVSVLSNPSFLPELIRSISAPAAMHSAPD